MYNLDNLKTFNEQQKKAVLHESGNIIISASAGSGKTRTMIERIIRLISENKATVKDVLAVTFTESAAADMKRKLKEKLIEQIKGGDAHISSELGEIATADICTLHSLCGKLCRAYFYALGISPDYKIIDESEAEGLRQDCLDRVFKSLYESGDKEFLDLTRKFAVKRSNRALKEIVLKIYKNATAEADDKFYLHKLEQVYSDSGFKDMLNANKEFNAIKLDRAKSLSEDGVFIARGNSLPKHEEFFIQLQNDIQVLCSGDLDKIDALKDYKRDLPRTKLPDDLKYLQQDAKAARDDVKDLIEKFCSKIKTKDVEYEGMVALKATTSALLGLVEAFTKEYDKQKREDNVLDFDDLMRFGLEILGDDEIAKEIRSKYKYVFVDEYQDINGVQEEILLKLSNDNLFMVGDPKQSIYGFRGCRPEIFEQKFERMEKEGKTAIRLNANYRCSRAVIDMTNEVFSYCMTKKFYGNDYAKNSMLIEGLDYDGKNDGRAKLFMPNIDRVMQSEDKDEQPRIYDVLEESQIAKTQDANELSLLVANIIRDELSKKFYDKESKSEKRITFGDICILTRNRESAYVSNLVTGLIKRGVPVTSSVEQNICDFPEASVLINFLKLIDNFKQNIPLAVVLKSALGGFSEEDLAEIVLKYQDDKFSGEFLDAYNYYLTHGEGSLKTRLNDFDEYIKALRFKADFIGAKGVLEKVVADKFYIEHLLATPLGKKKADRVRRFISLFSLDKGSLTVFEALEKIDKNKKAFGIAEETEENAVKVQTIHSSKGLEYPVVIVCGLEKNVIKSETRELALLDREWGIALSAFDDENKTYSDTLLRAVVLQKKLLDNIKEETRLFYVAMTRAQFSLYLTFENDKDQRESVFRGATKFIDYIPDSVKKADNYETKEIFEQALKSKKVIISQENKNLVHTFNSRYSYVYPFEKDTSLPLKNSVTQIVSGQKETQKEQNARLEQAILNDLVKIENGDDERVKIVLIDDDELLKGEVDLSKPITDSERGTIAHKVLEHYDFTSGKDLFSQVNEMLDKNVISKDELKSIDLERINKALSSSVFDCVKDRQVLKEKSFLVNVPAKDIVDASSEEEILVQGVIDLLVVGKNDAIVIDYKYSKADAITLKERYFKQLDLYAFAVEKILGKKVTQKTLVNIYSGEVITL